MVTLDLVDTLCMYEALIRNCFMNMKKQQGKCENLVSLVRNELFCFGLRHFWEQTEVTYAKQFVLLTDAFIRNC